MTARAALRTATREAHDRVDAAFGGHDLADRRAYGQFLSAQAAALLPVEQALDIAGAAGIDPDWELHRRGPLVLADLAELGVGPAPLIKPPSYASEAEVAGGLYVLEGSRLGGAVLRRAVPGALPSAFLSAAQSPGRWPRFVATLDQMLYSSQRLDAAVEAALATFACFEKAAQRVGVA